MKLENFSKIKGISKPINLCFWSTTGNVSLFLYDVIMMSFPVVKHHLVMKHHQRKGIPLCFGHTKYQNVSTLYKLIIAI